MDKMFMKYFLILIAVILSCQPKLSSNEIIEKSIVAHGYTNTHTFSFEFREKQYSIRRQNGLYTYRKIYGDTVEELTNAGFKIYTQQTKTTYTKKDSALSASALNSVVYFASLPYPLNDPAVQAEQLESEKYNEQTYYKIKVTFREEGGGNDYQDMFIYWINQKSFLIDFLAYSYHTNGGGSRFRAVTERQIKNGIFLNNYANYKTESDAILLTDMLAEFSKNALIKVSNIVLK